MQNGLRTFNLSGEATSEQRPEVIVVNVSVSGSRLGGAAIAAEWHSRFLREFIDVELWRMWDDDSKTSLDNLCVRNFNTQLPLKSFTSLLPRRAKALLLTSEILPQILKFRPEIIHLQNPGPALEFERITKICTQHGIKVVASTHGFYEVFNPNYNWKWYEECGWRQWMVKPIARSFEYIDAFLSGYPAEKQLLLEKGVAEAKIHLIPNGVSPYFEESPIPEECRQVLEKFNIKQDRPVLLFIGNHTPNKGINTVLEVAARLTVPSTVVVGGRLLFQNEPKERLTQMPKNCLAKIIFTDYLSEREQRALYHSATLLLFPSLADTLPLTILEAMACNLPVVAYATGGIPYQLANQSGVCVEQGNRESFVNAVEKLLASPCDRESIKVNAKRRQMNLFSWMLAAQKTIQVYDSLSLTEPA